MKKALLLSAISCIILCVVTFLVGGVKLSLQYNFRVGIVLLLVGAVLSGSMISGDRLRANINTSSKEDTLKRDKWTGILMVSSLPFIIISILLYTFG